MAASQNAVAAEFLRVSKRELLQNLGKIEAAAAKLTPGQIWGRAHENENSIGNLLLHLSGNVRQWIVSGVGGAPDERDRAAEFAARGPVEPREILARLRAAVEEAVSVLDGLEGADLLEQRRIQVFDVTLLHAIYHCVEHFSGHTGQILWIVKNRTGEPLGYYGFLEKGQAPPGGREP